MGLESRACSWCALGPDTRLSARCRVQFIDEHGLEEAGVDGGGLFKEFLEVTVRSRKSARTSRTCSSMLAPPRLEGLTFAYELSSD